MFLSLSPCEIRIDTAYLEELILKGINAVRAPDDQLTWEQYERLLAEEREQDRIIQLLAREEKLKSLFRALLVSRISEKETAMRLEQMTQRRWRSSARQSQNDQGVVQLAASLPVPPTVLNEQEAA